MTTPATPPPPPPAPGVSGPATTPSTSPATSPAPAGAGGRLRNGELRRQVAELLAARAGTEATPGDIARTLKRSSGAVGNALKNLADRGEAELTSTRPVRYRATATTAAAASATPTPPT
ncbi:hypothetical protein, partial [Acrocarpospora sp. B8E8]|uniref:hypothetical protein n=1 Tax=Acrocarpospora sp. B8E8 TaxID=3153572 RepID=UPI00325E68F6